MNYIETFYNNIVTYSLLNKFNYKKNKTIPKLKKMILTFNCKDSDLKKLASSLLALELISTKRGRLTTAKKSNALLKIRKGNPVGCKVILQKKLMYNFLNKLLIEIMPKMKNLKDFVIETNEKEQNTFSYTLKNNIIFFEFESNYYLFNNLPYLQITFITNAKTKNELLFLTNSIKLNTN